MSTRLLTVSGADFAEPGYGSPAQPQASYIRLRGQWLKAAGFEPGQRVIVRAEAPGRLVIELPQPEPSADLESERQAIIARLSAAITASREN